MLALDAELECGPPSGPESEALGVRAVDREGRMYSVGLRHARTCRRALPVPLLPVLKLSTVVRCF